MLRLQKSCRLCFIWDNSISFFSHCSAFKVFLLRRFDLRAKEEACEITVLSLFFFDVDCSSRLFLRLKIIWRMRDRDSASKALINRVKSRLESILMMSSLKRYVESFLTLKTVVSVTSLYCEFVCCSTNSRYWRSIVSCTKRSYCSMMIIEML